MLLTILDILALADLLQHVGIYLYLQRRDECTL